MQAQKVYWDHYGFSKEVQYIGKYRDYDQRIEAYIKTMKFLSTKNAKIMLSE